MAARATPALTTPYTQSVIELSKTYGRQGEILGIALLCLDVLKGASEFASAYFTKGCDGIVSIVSNELGMVFFQMQKIGKANNDLSDAECTAKVISGTSWPKMLQLFLPSFTISEASCKKIANYPIPLHIPLKLISIVFQGIFIYKNWKIVITSFLIAECWAVAHQFRAMLDDGSFKDTVEAPQGAPIPRSGPTDLAIKKIKQRVGVEGRKIEQDLDEKSHIDIYKLLDTTRFLWMISVPLSFSREWSHQIQEIVQTFVNTHFPQAGNAANT